MAFKWNFDSSSTFDQIEKKKKKDGSDNDVKQYFDSISQQNNYVPLSQQNEYIKSELDRQNKLNAIYEQTKKAQEALLDSTDPLNVLKNAGSNTSTNDNSNSMLDKYSNNNSQGNSDTNKESNPFIGLLSKIFNNKEPMNVNDSNALSPYATANKTTDEKSNPNLTAYGDLLKSQDQNNNVATNGETIQSTIQNNTTTPNKNQNEPSWLSTVKNSLLTGMAQTDEGLVNLVRLPYNGISKLWDKYSPDSFYDPKKDVINNKLNDLADFYRNQAQDYQNQLKSLPTFDKSNPNGTAKQFVNIGLQAVPQIVATMMAGSGLASKAGTVASDFTKTTGALGEAQSLAGKAGLLNPKVAQMAPFGAVAGSQYAREAEKEGASYPQQLAYGLAGGMAEAITEQPIISDWIDNVGGKYLVNGAKTISQKYGPSALAWMKDIGKEAFQEAVVDPMTGLAKKAIYKNDMPVVSTNPNQDAVFNTSQMSQDAYGGAAMAVIMAGLGLPSTALSHKYANNMVEKNLKNNTSPVPEELDNLKRQIEVDNNISNYLKANNIDINSLDEKTYYEILRKYNENPGAYAVNTQENSTQNNEPTVNNETTTPTEPATQVASESNINTSDNSNAPSGNSQGNLKVSKDGNPIVNTLGYGNVEVLNDDGRNVTIKGTDGTERKLTRLTFNSILNGEYTPKQNNTNSNADNIKNNNPSTTVQPTLIENGTNTLPNNNVTSTVSTGQNNNINENLGQTAATSAQENLNTNNDIQSQGQIDNEVKTSSNKNLSNIQDTIDQVKNSTDNNLPENIKSLNVNEIGVDPKRFQFKENTNDKGVTNELKGTDKFDPAQAGVVTVWQDKNGKNWIVNGHHRLELAKRTGAQNINAYILKESDGITEKDAREKGAIQNIGEGHGTAKDAAQIFREGSYTLNDIKDLGLSKTSNFVKKGYNISKLNDRLWNKVVNKTLSENQASIIGEALPNTNEKNSANQNAVIDYINGEGSISDSELKEVIDQVKNTEIQGQQMDLLGGQQFIFKNNFKDKTKLITKVKANLASEKSAFSNIINKKKNEIIKSEGNVLNDEANKKKLDLLKQGIGIIDIGKNKAGDPVNAILNKYSNEIAGGMTISKASELAVKDIMDLINKGGYLEHLNNAQNTENKGQQSILDMMGGNKNAGENSTKQSAPANDQQGESTNGNETKRTEQSNGGESQKGNTEVKMGNKSQEDLSKPTPAQEKEIEHLKERAKKLGYDEPSFAINGNGLIHVITKGKSNTNLKHTIFRDGQVSTGLMGGKDEKLLGAKVEEQPKEEIKDKPNTVSLDNWVSTVSKDDINYETAYNAYRATSFEPERRAKEEQTQYVNAMNNIYEKMSKLAETPEQKAMLVDELNKYKEKYINYTNGILQAKSRTMSAAITGPANFPTAKNQKALNAEHNKIVEFLAWKEKAEASIKNKIEKALTPEQAANKEYDRLIQSADFTIETLKEIENGTDKSSMPSLFRNSLRDKLMRSLSNGNVETVSKVLDYVKEKEKENLKRPVFSESNGIWKAVETAKEKTKSSEVKTGTESIKKYKGAEIVKNYEADRVQITFDEVPSEEVRKELKSTGWHFSKANGDVWQRKLTSNAEIVAQRIMDRHYSAETKAKSNPSVKGYAGTSAVAENETSQNNNGKPMNRKEMIDNLIKAIDIPARLGRYRKPGAVGIYKTHDEVIRTKMSEDVPTLSHEIGHHLDKTYGFSDLVKSDRNFNKEIMALGEEQAKLQNLDKEGQISEGIAEFLRKYLTNEETNAPYFEKYFKGIVDKKLLLQLNSFKAEYSKYQNATPGDRMLSQVDIKGSEKSFKENAKEKLKDMKENTFDRFYTSWIDELRPLYNLVKQGISKNVLSDPYRMAWLFRGWSGKAISAIKYGVYNYEGNKITKVSDGLNQILKPIKQQDMNDFRRYIIAKRVIEKESQGIKTGFDLEDSKGIVDKVENIDKNSSFIKAQKDLQTYQDAILRRLVDGGLMSESQYEKIKELNNDYVPFYRVLDSEGNSNGQYTSDTFGNVKNPVKKMNGGNASIYDPIESIVKNTYYFTNLAERNMVAQSLVNFAKENEGMGKFVENVTPKFSVTKFDLKEIKKPLEEAGVNLDETDLEQIATIFRPIMKASAGENIITVSIDGKTKLYQLNEDLYKSIMHLDRESSNFIFRIANAATKSLRAGAVLNPEFASRNITRDALSAFVYSKYNFIPILDTLKGLSHVIKKDETYQLWLNSGGAQSDFVSMDRDYLAKGVKEVLSKGKPSELMKDFIKNPLGQTLEGLRYISSFSEEATRLGHFSKGLNKLGTGREAMAELGISTRDVTLDFQRSGTVGKSANKIVAFFNATLQGQDKMIRTFKDPNTRNIALIKALASITLPSIILWLLFHDDDKIKELPLWRKDLFWNIPTENHVISIPKPFELGIIFGSLPERMLDKFQDSDAKAIQGWGSDFLGNLLPGVLPTAVEPGIEWWANKSFFRNTSIESQADLRLPASERYSPSTSLVAKKIGEGAKAIPGLKDGLSPKMIDNTIQGYTGGLGRDIVDLLDKIMGNKNEKPASELKQVPGIKGFVNEPYTQARSIDDFYQKKADIDSQYASTMKKLKAEHPELTDKDWSSIMRNDLTPYKNKVVQSLPDDVSQLHKQQYLYGKVGDYLSDVRKQEQTIYSDTKLSASAKQFKINELQYKTVQYLRKLNGSN